MSMDLLDNLNGDKGPAILDREPVVLAEQRQRAADRVKQRVQEVRGGGRQTVGGDGELSDAEREYL